jgi:hypothetical protein
MTTATATQTPNTTEPVTETKVHQVDLIVDPSALFEKMQEWTAKGWHVLSPATRISHLAPGWGVSVSLVVLDTRIDENGNGVDCYFDKGSMKSHERGISRIGLDRICRCAGISWDPVHCGRTDTRLIMHFAEFRAIGVVMNFDGTPETLSATGCCDYRDGSADIGYWTPEDWRKLELGNEEKKRVDPKARLEWSINGWSAKRVLGARSKMLQRAETNAKERAIRSLGLRHKYTVDELANPFVVLKASYLPNMEDPTIRQMVAERAMNGTRALFSQTQRPMDIIDVTPVRPAALPEAQPAARIEKPQQREAVPVAARDDIAEAMPTLQKNTPQREDSSDRVATSEATARPVAGVEAAPVNALYITDVKFLKEGTGRKGPWSMYRVAFSDGKSYSAFDAEGLIDDCRTFEKDRTPVEIDTKQDGSYLNLVDIRPAGAQPSIPGMAAAGFAPSSDLKL